ncbi:C3a anaphylatoxin chemotactic receptor [Pelodytes ibericus]
MSDYTPETWITVTILTITFLVGVPGNILVIWVTAVKMKRTVNTVWFGNLALADITCCLSLPLTIAFEFLHHEWPYGSFLCKVLPSVIILNMFASVFTLVVISMDRCVLVVKPVWSQNHRTVRSAWFVCVGIWLLSLLMCLPVLLYRETTTYENTTICDYVYTRDYPDSLENYNWDWIGTERDTSGDLNNLTVSNQTNMEEHSSGWSTSSNPLYNSELQREDYYSTFDLDAEPNASSHHVIITVTRTIFGFLLPAVVISACYIRLAWKMQGTRFAKMSRKTRKVVFGIVLAFYLSWTPYHIVGLAIISVNSTGLHRLDSLSQALAYSNSCINPVLYVFMGKDFKKKMCQSLRGLMESTFSEEATQTNSRGKSRISVVNSTTM